MLYSALRYPLLITTFISSKRKYRKIDPSHNLDAKTDSLSFLICMRRAAKIHVLDWFNDQLVVNYNLIVKRNSRNTSCICFEKNNSGFFKQRSWLRLQQTDFKQKIYILL